MKATSGAGSSAGFAWTWLTKLSRGTSRSTSLLVGKSFTNDVAMADE
jgi:hypothetical protein